MTNIRVIAALVATVNCQSGDDLLYAETRSPSSGDGPVFSEPLAPVGNANYDYDYDFAEPTFTTTSAPVGQAMPGFDAPMDTVGAGYDEYGYEDYDYGYDMGYEGDWDYSTTANATEWELPMNETMDWDAYEDAWKEEYDYYYDYDPAIAESGMASGNWTAMDDMYYEGDWQMEQMRSDFRDYFDYAISGEMWEDYSMPMMCDDSCNSNYNRCCVEVSMYDRDTGSMNSENYCMDTSIIDLEQRFDFMQYEVDMRCMKDGRYDAGSARIAATMLSAAALIPLVY